MSILYTHRTDYGNPGDMWSTPLHYVDSSMSGAVVDIYHLPLQKTPSYDTLIVGGGGLFYDDHMLGKLTQQISCHEPKRLIIWGVGSTPGVADDLFARADLVGVRQRYDDSTWEWLPCASVLHPGIDARRKIKSTKNFLVVDHWKRKPIGVPGVDITRTTNNPATIEHLLDLIAQHEYIITASYHVWYWSTLMRRKVVVCADPVAISRKFVHLPYPTPVAESFSWELLDLARVYPDAKAECTALNLDFARRVMELINS